MKYKHGKRVALASINKSLLINDTKSVTFVMDNDYKKYTPTPSASVFMTEMGLLDFIGEDFYCEAELLGSGFFAEVYKVKQNERNIVMALKVPKNTESMSRFMKEVRLLKRLNNNNNVLRFYGTCIFNGLFGCLTEYLDSGTLSNLIERQGPTLEWSTGVGIAEDICEGLRYLHQQSIIHRDLSSENILLHKLSEEYAMNNKLIVNYRAVIADFGLFLDMKKKGSDRMSTVGNPFYTAPENLKNESPYDYSSDVFSFGMILCEIITGLRNDPTKILRTNNYGLDYKQLKVKKDCPKWLQGLACDCCMVYVVNRPSLLRVREIITENKKYINLWRSFQTPKKIQCKLSHSFDGMKQRTMSLSVNYHGIKNKVNVPKNNPSFYTTYTHDEELFSETNAYNGKSRISPVCRYNSVDSFIDPRLLNLHKAFNDPGYIDKPLTISMKNLDPRLHSLQHFPKRISRCSSESDLVLLFSAKKHSPRIDSSLFDESPEIFFDYDSIGASTTNAISDSFNPETF